MSDQHLTDQAIFEIARHLGDPAARRAYLDQACGDNAAQRERLVELLEACPTNDSFLESPAIPLDSTPTIDAPPTLQPGDQIGLYKLLQQVGEGGMGAVWMAEQLQPVRR